jgi:hypothetical protein
LAKAAEISSFSEYQKPTYQSLVRSREFLISETISIVHKLQYYLKLIDLLKEQRQAVEKQIFDLDMTSQSAQTASAAPVDLTGAESDSSDSNSESEDDHMAF